MSIISYRDPGCAATLADLFAKAAVPNRIYAGVCEQNLLPRGSEEDCRPEALPKMLRDNVSTR